MSWENGNVRPSANNVYENDELSSDGKDNWPVDRVSWNNSEYETSNNQQVASSETASMNKTPEDNGYLNRQSQSPDKGIKFDAKIEVICSLLEMLLGETVGREDTSTTLLTLSNSEENCLAMRKSGCLPLLIQLIHSPEQNPVVREGASKAFYNIIKATQDLNSESQELHVFELIKQLRDYSEILRRCLDSDEDSNQNVHPILAISNLMKLSFNPNHRQAMCQTGGLHAIAELIEMDHLIHGSDTDNIDCISLRRHAGMTLTNLTFGDSKNKSILCSFTDFIKVWVLQLERPNEELHQVTASVLRNLSWRAEPNSKKILQEVGSVTYLTKAAMLSRRESTLKSILSALWNLSAHCTKNKADICLVNGALEFLVDMINFKLPSKRLAIIENAGGILRNISSHIAVVEDYRKILRQKNCINILVDLLKSPSLTVISNACGTLWNLSARCPQDQKTLWDLGTVPTLRTLVYSKHKMISMGACATLKNLLASRNLTNTFYYFQPNFRSSIQLNVNSEKNHPVLLDSSTSSHSRTIVNNKSKISQVTTKSWNLGFPSSTPDDNSKSTVDEEKDTDESYQVIRKGSPVEYFEQDGDQPIDYSKKYMENRGIEKRKIKSRRNSNIFGDYAETDLDQPTDYSLRYAEDDDTDDEDQKEETPYYNVNEQEDTLKTYYTEGTPYKTSCTISTATSMSDLRLEESKDVDITKKDKDQADDDEEGEEYSKEKAEIHSETKIYVSKVSLSIKNTSKSVEENREYYSDDGTPGKISRVNSPNSIDCNIRTDEMNNQEENGNYSENNNLNEKAVKVEEEEEEEEEEEITNEEKTIDKEGKVVTFGEDHYCEETPLMFSRSSSLGSLSGFEQHSIHDDRSSIISEYSRRTSGVVSPIELSDSPTRLSEIISSSPQNKIVTNNNNSSNNNINNTNSNNSSINILSPTTYQRRETLKFTYDKIKTSNSIFEDNTAAFKEESTPIEFSAATSLSSLTIDDEPKIILDLKIPEIKTIEIEKEMKESGVGGIVEEIVSDKDHVTDEEEDDDENILAACINIGMQNTRYKQQQQQNLKKIDTKDYHLFGSNLTRYQTSSTLDRLENDIKRSPVKSKLNNTNSDTDTVHIYYTEDTPADISPLGSQSNLSALSMPSILEDFEKPDELLHENKDDLSDISLSGGEEEEDKILDECIQSRMPKKITSISHNKSPVGFYSNPQHSYLTNNNNSFDDSPNHSDDDAILTEFIESAMTKPRLSSFSSKPSTSRPIINDSSYKRYRTNVEVEEEEEEDEEEDDDDDDDDDDEDDVDHDDEDEDEEDIILAQCIRSGMPKASNSSMTNYSPKNDPRRAFNGSLLSSSNNSSPRHIPNRHNFTAAQDETSNFETEDTPCNFSVISEISNLSLNSSPD